MCKQAKWFMKGLNSDSFYVKLYVNISKIMVSFSIGCWTSYAFLTSDCTFKWKATSSIKTKMYATYSM